MKKIILGILLILFFSRTSYGTPAISEDKKLESQESNIRVELTQEMDKEFSDLEKKLTEKIRSRVDSRYDSSMSLVDTLLMYLGLIVAILAFIVTLAGLVTFQKAKRATQELKEAKKDCEAAKKDFLKAEDFLKNKMKKHCEKTDKEFLKAQELLNKKIKAAWGDVERYKEFMEEIIGEKWDRQKPLLPEANFPEGSKLNSRQEKQIDEILSQPAIPVLFRLQAMALKTQNNSEWEESIFLWKMIKALGIETPEVETYMGLVYLQLSKDNTKTNYKRRDYARKAIECYQKAIKNQENHQAYMNCGSAYYCIGNDDKALEMYEKALDGEFAREANYSAAITIKSKIKGLTEAPNSPKKQKEIEELQKKLQEYTQTYKALGGTPEFQ